MLLKMKSWISISPRTLPLALLLLPQLPFAQAQSPAAPPPGAQQALTIDLQNAIARAKANSQQLLSVQLNTSLAREDRFQAKAGLLPTLSYNNQYIYTQGNGTPSGVFIANDGVHVYNSQATVHEEFISVARLVEYRRSVLAQTVAEAKAEVAARGLVEAVVQDYYALVVAQRHALNAEQSLQESRRFVEITEKLEKGGEVARADTVKAQIVLRQRQRDFQDAQLAIEKARIALSVLIFAELKLDFIVVDDLKTAAVLGPIEEIRARAVDRNPDLRAAQLTLQHETLGVSAARSEYLPTFSFDYWFGINANEFAARTPERKNLGYSAQATLNIPIFNWGITRSKVRQAEFRQRQAQLDVSLTRKELLSGLNSLYAEAQSSFAQIDSLLGSLDLAAESLRLTMLRYQAGEVSILEVVDSQSTVAQARNAYDDGLSRYRIASAQIQNLTGTL